MKNRIKYFIRVKNTTMRAVAEELHVSPSVFSFWVNNDSVPAYFMPKIARILGTTKEALSGND